MYTCLPAFVGPGMMSLRLTCPRPGPGGVHLQWRADVAAQPFQPPADSHDDDGVRYGPKRTVHGLWPSKPLPWTSRSCSGGPVPLSPPPSPPRPFIGQHSTRYSPQRHHRHAGAKSQGHDHVPAVGSPSTAAALALTAHGPGPAVRRPVSDVGPRCPVAARSSAAPLCRRGRSASVQATLWSHRLRSPQSMNAARLCPHVGSAQTLHAGCRAPGDRGSGMAARMRLPCGRGTDSGTGSRTHSVGAQEG